MLQEIELFVGGLDRQVDPPGCLLNASLPEVLLAVPGFGKVRVNRLLNRCRISPSKRVRGLPRRQRQELVGALVERI